jgi:hypothetical protein
MGLENMPYIFFPYPMLKRGRNKKNLWFHTLSSIPHPAH